MNNITPYTIEKLNQEQLNQKYQALASKERLLPIKVPPFYASKIKEEISKTGRFDGPLHRTVYPTMEKIHLRAPGEVNDFVDDRSNMPDGLSSIVIRKYRERMLFLPTTRCIGHCQYCFRQDVLSEANSKKLNLQLTERVNKLKNYLNSRNEVQEVILSGGDPLSLSTKHLTLVLDAIHDANKQLMIRIHTRTLAFSPDIFSNEKIDLLGRHRVRLVSHFVHPYEVCEIVSQKLCSLSQAGVRLYNQFPLLRGINDHELVLAKLLHKLDDYNVRTLTMFIPDAINYSASFRISLERLWSLINKLNWSTPSWINSVRTVLDTPFGKVRREDFVRYDKVNKVAIFSREGKEIEYPDLPQDMDTPGDLKLLLWQDSN